MACCKSIKWIFSFALLTLAIQFYILDNAGFSPLVEWKMWLKQFCTGIGKWIKNLQFVQWLENMDTLRLIVVILIHWFYDTYLFIYQTITNTYYWKHFHYYTNIVFSNLWFQVFIILISKRGFLSPHDKVMFHLRSVLKKRGTH